MNYIPRREPDYRRNALDQRVVELRHAVRGGQEARIIKAAEKLRAATLALIKAHRSKIETDNDVQLGRNPKRIDALMRKLTKLGKEWEEWMTMTVEEIVRKHVPENRAR